MFCKTRTHTQKKNTTHGTKSLELYANREQKQSILGASTSLHCTLLTTCNLLSLLAIRIIKLSEKNKKTKTEKRVINDTDLNT